MATKKASKKTAPAKPQPKEPMCDACAVEIATRFGVSGSWCNACFLGLTQK